MSMEFTCLTSTSRCYMHLGRISTVFAPGDLVCVVTLGTVLRPLLGVMHFRKLFDEAI